MNHSPSHASRLRVVELRQAPSAPAFADVGAAVREQLGASGLRGRLGTGARIAITAGSRGIANAATILRTVADFVREAGASPFFVPAMGSHGGGTAEGQLALLAAMGITEESVGAPIRSSVETTHLGEAPAGTEVRIDRIAAAADGIIAVNRVKAHTDYSGPTESGLMKMLAVGLGNEHGAVLVHSWGLMGLRDIVPQTARVILQKAKVLLGLAIIENSEAETAMVEAVPPEAFEERDAALLVESKRLAPRIPFDDLDVLIVRWLGKDVSGTGLDTHVIGRMMHFGHPEPERPRIRMVGVLDLTEASRGNAVGIGLADLTTQRLVDKISREATYKNAYTARSITRARIPVTLPTDRDVFDWALHHLPPDRLAAPRVAIIRDTLHLARLHISEALMGEAKAIPGLEVGDRPVPLVFDAGRGIRDVRHVCLSAHWGIVIPDTLP
jgi:hypothetical protein